PGNIREMQNVIERAVILSHGTALRIDAAELPVATRPSGARRQESDNRNGAPPPGSLASAEREHILGVLRETGWVLSGPNGAAVKLAMKRTTLQSKMKKLGIARPM